MVRVIGCEILDEFANYIQLDQLTYDQSSSWYYLNSTHKMRDEVVYRMIKDV